MRPGTGNGFTGNGNGWHAGSRDDRGYQPRSLSSGVPQLQHTPTPSPPTGGYTDYALANRHENPVYQPAIANVGDLFDFPVNEDSRDALSFGQAASLQFPQSGTYWSGAHLLKMERKEDIPPLASQPVREQEASVIKDLFLAFLGVGGRYVQALEVPLDTNSNSRQQGDRSNGGPPPRQQRRITFVFGQHDADAYVAELARRMLCICEYIAVVERFCEARKGFSHGRVSHALVGRLRELVQRWRGMVVRFKGEWSAQPYSLQELWCRLQAVVPQLQALAEVCGEAAARRLCGASLLSYLHKCTTTCMGDRDRRRQLEELTKLAARPYFATLRTWLDRGRIQDPCNEFMVESCQQVANGGPAPQSSTMQWEQQYCLRLLPGTEGGGTAAQDIPSFLEGCRDAILVTGKYHIARGQCTQSREDDSSAAAESLEYDVRGNFSRAILARHAAASSALLTQLRNVQGLPQMLQGLRDYMLLGRGDFLVAFLDEAQAELLAEAPRDAAACAAVQSRLQGMLDLAMRATLQGPEDDVIVNRIRAVDAPQASPRGESKGPLRLHSLLSLTCQVPWPLSVVVGEAAQARYQAASKHLWGLKLVERRLCTAWRSLQALRPLHKDVRTNRTCLQALGHCNMAMAFFRLLLLYETFEVLEPLWRSLQDSVTSASTLEQVLETHEAFLDRLRRGWLLTRSADLSTALANLQTHAHAFCDMCGQLDRAAAPAQGQTPASVAGGSPAKLRVAVNSALQAANALAAVSDLVKEESLWGKKLRNSIFEFDRSLMDFVKKLEKALREAHAAGDEHIGDIGSMEAVLDRIKAGFMGSQKKGLLNPDLNAQLQAMRLHKLPAA
ncbi:hypothetical protein WJX73_000765 [Symbiochloris irregularis]|uniref:Gamma-tubulin complex component n=1 Tax=Symbiochloris irregularis TaxID=706552 RepID=A0AAW1PMQ2_9CHLO